MGAPVILPLAAIIALIVWVMGLLAGLVALLRKTLAAKEVHTVDVYDHSLGFWWIIWALAAVVSLLLFLAVFLPAGSTAREAPRRISCVNNLKQIVLAMYTYQNHHGCYPPAYIADEQGRPMHSWRVLLLPLVEQEGIHEQYDFDLPWNSPHNLALGERMPEVYHCPQDAGAADTETSYVMLVGPGAISDGPTARTIKEITDGTSNTIMVAERSQSGIHWMEPRDLNVVEMSFRIDDMDGNGIRSTHPGIANVGFGDGSVHSVNEDIDPEILKAIITIDAGDRGSEFHTMY